MANIDRNITIRGLTDLMGDKLLKSLLAREPIFHDGVPGAETTQRESLRAAATYASFAQSHEVYVNKARGQEATAYSLALADWLGGPRLLEIDIDDWTGEVGQMIRIKARDNIRVARVSVVIRDVQGHVLEKGEAVRSAAGGPWWIYTTHTRIPLAPFPSVEATARDLPGHCDSFTI